jgi:hypothetical protein
MSLSIWVLYDHPSDFPHSFVARRWKVSGKGEEPTGDTIQREDLESIRNELAQRQLYRLDRMQRDDPKILEVWL